MNNNCTFCKIIQGKLPCYKLYEDDLVIAFLDKYPFFKGHTLIVPKNHYQDITELPDNIASQILVVGKKLVKVFIKTYNPEGFNFFQAHGRIAGQSVMHYHMHLLPRYAGGPSGGLTSLSSKDINFDNPSKEEMEKLTENIRKHLN